jgi:hypothetical protein
MIRRRAAAAKPRCPACGGCGARRGVRARHVFAKIRCRQPPPVPFNGQCCRVAGTGREVLHHGLQKRGKGVADRGDHLRGLPGRPARPGRDLWGAPGDPGEKLRHPPGLGRRPLRRLPGQGQVLPGPAAGNGGLQLLDLSLPAEPVSTRIITGPVRQRAPLAPDRGLARLGTRRVCGRDPRAPGRRGRRVQGAPGAFPQRSPVSDGLLADLTDLPRGCSAPTGPDMPFLSRSTCLPEPRGGFGRPSAGVVFIPARNCQQT